MFLRSAILFSSSNGFGVSNVNGFNLLPNPAHKIKAVLIFILLTYKFREIRSNNILNYQIFIITHSMIQ